jgi:hypothetical protein
MDSGSVYKIAHSELDDGAEPHASLFVSLSRNRTGALSPNNRNGALRQFVSKACSATPELAFLAGRPRSKLRATYWATTMHHA